MDIYPFPEELSPICLEPIYNIDKTQTRNATIPRRVCLRLLFVRAFWIGWEPSSGNARFLFDHFMDAPERGESKKRDGGVEHGILHTQAHCHTQRAYSAEKRHTHFTAEMIFALDDDRMPDANDEKRQGAQYDPFEIHGFPPYLQMIRYIQKHPGSCDPG